MKASTQAMAKALGKGRLADPDRIELGIATPDGYFDWLATFAYRRRVLTDARFEHHIQAELTYGKRDYLTEGAASFGWYFRPEKWWHPEWRIRPVIEGGIGGHVSVQFADLVGFDDWSSHAEAFLKTHLVGGVETDLTDRLGIALRGRFSIPAHQPLDYAQLVLFLR